MRTRTEMERVLQLAHAVASSVLPPYSQPKSPHLFTQPQLFSCLVLKEFMRLDYRELTDLLTVAPRLRSAIGMRGVPHHTTFVRASRRLLTAANLRSLLDEIIWRALELGIVESPSRLAAIDSSGFEAHHASAYYVNRQSQTKKPQRVTCPHYPTLGIIVDCKSHLILAAHPSLGPWPEIDQFPILVRAACRRIKIDTLLGDKAYDAERSHRVAREECAVRRTLIPARRPANCFQGEIPQTKYRREMRVRFKPKVYHQRWQVETTFSMIKRSFGSSLAGRTGGARYRELRLRAVALDIKIVR